MNPGDTDFPPSCLQCGHALITTWIGKGKARKPVTTCGCEPPPAPAASVAKARKVKNTSAKGGGEELRVVKFCQGVGFTAHKTAGSGATASRHNESAWDTDIICRLSLNGQEVFRAKIESKFMACVPGLKSMVGMRSRSDWLRVRENNGIGYWFLPDAEMERLLSLAKAGLEAEQRRAA